MCLRDLRYPVLLAGVMLHLGLEYSMNIQLFQWVMLTALVLFIDPRDFRRRPRALVDTAAPSATQTPAP